MPIFSRLLVSKLILLLWHNFRPLSFFVAFKHADDEFSLVNANVAMVIKGGRIVSLKDVGQKWVTLSLTRTPADSLHRSRELILPGLSGGLVVFDDRPNYWVRLAHGSFW